MTRKVLTAVGVMAVLFTACGGDDDDVSVEAEPYVDALIASAAEQDPGDVQFDEGQAECLAPRWVEVLGPARLEEAGVTPEELAESDDAIPELDLSEDEGAALYDAMVDCDIDTRQQVLANMVEESDLSEDDRDCLQEQFDDDLLRRMFIVALTQGEDALTADEELTSDLLRVFSECPGAVPEG